MDRRIQKTRKAIQDAYFRLLKEEKGRKITISKIAQEANIDRKTFYLHYESVEDILKAFSDERIEELLADLKETEFFEDPLKLGIVFELLNAILERDMDIYRDLSREASYSYFWDRLHMIMVRALVNVYADKVSVSGEEFGIYCDFFISGLIHIYQGFLRDPESTDPQKFSDIVVDIALNGVSHLFALPR